MRGSLRGAWGWVFAAQPALAVGAVVLSLAAAAIPLGMVWLSREVLDGAAAGDGARVWRAAVAEGALMGALGLVQVAAGLCLGLLVVRAGQYGHLRVLTRAALAPYARFEEPQFYDRLRRATKEAATRPIAVFRRTLSVGEGLIGVLGSAALLAAISPAVGLLMVAGTVPRFLLDRWFNRRYFDLMTARAPVDREVAYLDSALSRDDHAREVRLFGLAAPLLQRIRRRYEEMWTVDRDLAVRRALAEGVVGTANAALFYGMYVWVALAAASGRLSVGDIGLMLAAVRAGEGALNRLLLSAGSLLEDRLYLGHITAFEQDVLPEPDGGAPAGADLRDGLRLESVTFRYPGAERDAVSGVSLHVAPGEKVAIVGANGAGKSTLIKLILGLYAPTAGEVRFQGRPLADWSPSAARARMSAMLQDFVRFQLTLRENVGIADPAADDGAITAALSRGLGAALLRELPGGLDAQLGRWFEGGVELSGGQWQRVALARALLREDAPLWLLDEPTAAMDPEAEVALFQRLREDYPEKSVVLVTHRLSAVRLADRVVVLDGGRIVEEGPHDALIAAGGRYAALFTLQAEGYR